MQSEFSWLVLVLAFAAIAVGCAFLLLRLRRMASPKWQPQAASRTASSGSDAAELRQS
jgi:hypothetical protein